MRYSIPCVTAMAVSVAYAAPFTARGNSKGVSFPLANGFPNPSQSAINQIQKDAQGTLPNGAPPPSMTPEGLTNLKLIALNELFEVAFFTELAANISSRAPGYDLGEKQGYVLDAIKAIVAQEELHLLNANGALKHFNQAEIQPCRYSFPVTDFESAIGLAQTFTDLVLGTLQDVSDIFARSQDYGLVRAVASVIGNEAQQDGFFRSQQKKIPSAQPFLTGSARDFAFTAIQSFVVPGSCPNIHTIPLKTFKGLTIKTKKVQPKTQHLKFAFSKKDAGMFQIEHLRVVYLNGQSVPVVKPLMDVQTKGDSVTFSAEFPYDEFVMDGLTIAAVTSGADSFDGPDAVAQKTLFGPGLIELN